MSDKADIGTLTYPISATPLVLSSALLRNLAEPQCVGFYDITNMNMKFRQRRQNANSGYPIDEPFSVVLICI